ncbi:p21-activated protein kinase-interacting protein 1 isoform X2 [Callithrix jacchus]
MELVAGCYEQVLFGVTVHPKSEACGDREQWTPVADFTHHAHTASLSAVAVNSRFVVTGSKDETIHIYDMKKKIEHGALVHHSDAHLVEWSPRGEQYVVIIQNKIDIYQLDTASISGTITNEKRISAVKFLSESVLAVAGDEEVIRFFDCDSLVCLCEFKAHENRDKRPPTTQEVGVGVLKGANVIVWGWQWAPYPRSSNKGLESKHPSSGKQNRKKDGRSQEF